MSKKKSNVIVSVIKGIGKGYRGITDWAKPTIDRTLDPIFTFLGSNALLSTGIYYANKFGVQPKLDDIFGEGKAQEFFENNSIAEGITKIATYGAIYFLANRFAILPLAKRAFWSDKTPSWAGHIKTWTMIGGSLLAYYQGGIKEDVSRLKDSFVEADDFGEYVDVFTDQFRVADKYFSGQKSTGFLEDIIEQGYVVKRSISKKIKNEIERIKNEDSEFEYSGQVYEDTKEFIKDGMINSPEQAIYLTRVLYFEGGWDPKAKTDDQLKEGLEGIASVIYNRYKYDTDREDNGKKRQFSRKGDNLFDLAFLHGKNKYGGTTWQFTCIRDHPEYFYKHEGEEGWDMYGNGKLNIAVGDMDSIKTDWCYNALLNVISGNAEDNTNGALFYKNSATSDSANQNWEKRYGVKKVETINSHDFYRPKDLPDNWVDKLD